MKPGYRAFHVYAQVSETERDRVREQAALEGLTVSNFVRRCINAYLVDIDDGGLLLEECTQGRPHAH
jgi:hypothetical protein